MTYRSKVSSCIGQRYSTRFIFFPDLVLVVTLRRNKQFPSFVANKTVVKLLNDWRISFSKTARRCWSLQST